MKLMEVHDRRELLDEIETYFQLETFTPETESALGQLRGNLWDRFIRHPIIVQAAQKSGDELRISERTIMSAIEDLAGY